MTKDPYLKTIIKIKMANPHSVRLDLPHKNILRIINHYSIYILEKNITQTDIIKQALLYYWKHYKEKNNITSKVLKHLNRKSKETDAQPWNQNE